jgi:hypothetical protein
MAIATAANQVIRPEFFEAGFLQGVGQNIEVFNEQSNGTLQFETRDLEGDFAKTRFFDRISSLVTYRDDTSTSSVTSESLTTSDHIAVKTKRKIGPVENTVDSLETIASDEEEFSMMFGRQAGEDAAENYLNTALGSAVSALSNQGPNYVDESGSSSNTLTHALLNDLLSAFGDARGDIVALVMHSKAFNDLVGNNISSSGDQTEFATIYREAPGSFQRPVVVTDSPDLINTDGISTGTDSYYTLGLQEGAMQVSESDSLRIFDEVETGSENVTFRAQGESAITLDMLGFTWDETNGGRNPNDSALKTGSNWDTDHSEEKNRAGVVLEHA